MLHLHHREDLPLFLAVFMLQIPTQTSPLPGSLRDSTLVESLCTEPIFLCSTQVTLVPLGLIPLQTSKCEHRGSLSSSRRTYCHPQAVAQRSATLPPPTLTRNLSWGFQSPYGLHLGSGYYGLAPETLPESNRLRSPRLDAGGWVQPPSLDCSEEGREEGIFIHFSRPPQLSMWVSNNRLQPPGLESDGRCLLATHLPKD